MMGRTSVCVAALTCFAFFGPMPAGPEEAPVRGFDLPSYEVSFLRAERESDPERWLREARSVGSAAGARWERDAAALYADSESMSSDRSELRAWTEADLAERFAAWLRDRFFGREAAALREIVSKATEAADAVYLYLTNPDGSVQYDEAGDPRYSVGSDLAVDRAAWTGIAESATDEALSAFSARFETLRPELLALIPEEERARYAGMIEESAEAVRGRFATELDALVARDERLFVARRTSDVWSLRSGSEGEAAAAIAATLAAEAGSACAEGLSALSARIEAIVASADDPEVAGSDWLDDFSLQFDRGLSAWKGAEERFMVRRLEWERDAATSYEDGSEAWASAYERLAEESRAWEERAGALLREGEESFGRASAALEADIRQARAEFERDANERATASAERAGAWIDVYLQSCYAATSAREGADYWLSRLGDGAPAFGGPSMGAWLDAEESAADPGSERNGTIMRLRDCIALYDEFSEKAFEAKDRLVADFGLAMGTEAGSLKDVLNAGSSSDDFYLDEYQVELLRAEAVEAYWTKRAWIARAVLEYAEDLSSGRSTEAESMRLMEEAAARYDEALAAYGSTRDALSDSGGALGEAGSDLDAARDALAAAGGVLEAANSAYATAMAALVSGGDGATIRDELYAQYRRLVVYSGLSTVDGDPSEAGLVAAYLEKARILGYAEDIERSGEALRDAVNGLPGEPSLYELSLAYERITVPADRSTAPLDVEAYGFDHDDPAYSTLEALFRDMRSRIADTEDPARIDRIVSSYRGLAASVAEGARIRVGEALASRLDGIALLGATNVDDWYAERSGFPSGYGDMQSRLDADIDAARRSLLEARARLELEAIRGLLGDAPSALAASLFGEDALDGALDLESARASLERLVATIASHADSGAAEFSTAIEALAGSDAAIAMFARGRGFFAVDACDVASLYLVDETAALEKARGRSAAFSRYGSYSVAAGTERVAAVSAMLGDALSGLGLSFDGDGRLPDAEALVEAIIGRSGVEVQTLAELVLAVETASRLAPAWVASELSGWLDSILAHAAVVGASAGIGDPLAGAAYVTMLADSDARASVLAAVLGGLSGSEGEVVEATRLAQASIDWSDAERELMEEEVARISSGSGEAPIDDTADDVAAEEIAASYAGEYSGDPLRWATRRCGGDARMAIRVVRSLEADSRSEPFARWLIGAVSDKAVALMADARRLSALVSCSRAIDQAGSRERAAAAAGEKHWREYLLDPSSGWAEGASADASEESRRRTASLDEALRSWGDYVEGYGSIDDDSAFSDFTAVARRYIENPESLFEPSDIIYAPNLAAYDYGRAVDEYRSLAQGRQSARTAIARLGDAYESLADPGRIQERLASLATEILEGDARYDEAQAAYSAAGNAFEAAGAMYDSAYGGASASYESLEEERAVFEKEDAIRRWASTAYLAVSGDHRSPAEELALAEESSARASAALAALADLYSDDTGERPYADPEYASAYSAYKAGYSRMMLAAAARDAVAGALQKEIFINANAYEAFRNSYTAIERGAPAEAFGDYLTIDADGSIRLAFGPDFSFIEGSGSESISAYFSEAMLDPESGRVDSTAFHIALDELSAWMGSVDFSVAKARQWGLARDYVLGRLVAADADFAALIEYKETGIDENLLGSGRFVLLGKPISEILEDYRDGELVAEKRRAYESMGTEEKAWFEKYLALRISGAIVEPGAGDESTYDGFSYWSSRAEYEKLEAEADRETRICETGLKVSAGVYAGALLSAAAASASLFFAFLAPGFLVTASVAYAAMAAFGLSIGGIDSTRGVYAAEMRDLVAQTDAAAAAMTDGMSESARLKDAYLASCARLDVLSGARPGDGAWDPAALREALVAAGWTDEADLDAVTSGYSTFAAETGAQAENAAEALSGMAAWSMAIRDDGRDALERAYADDEASRLVAEASYREVYGRYIEGDAGAGELAAAIEAAYGAGSSSMKSHLSGIAKIVEEASFDDDSSRSSVERSEAASLYGSLVQRVLATRLAAEYAARSAEWEIAREALLERRVAWRESGGLILSRGRADFERGAALVRDSASAWAARFGAEYASRTAAWDCATADMLEFKLSWVARATAAADVASSEAIFALVGSDAESAARRMDTVFVSAVDFKDGASEAYADVMAMAGIAGMSGALSDRTGSLAASSGTIRSGVSGAGAWNYGRIRVAAADYAERVNRRLAGTQAAMMASRARETAAAAVAGLEGSVRSANEDFNHDMNETFVADGKWQRSGDSYVKEVVVHATVVDPYITESARVSAYAYFDLGAWSVETDLSDAVLSGLDSLGIRTLIAKAQDEVAAKSEAAFGDGGASEFGAWIGRAPELADGADPDDGQSSLFSDPGAGELGRLVSAYIYWAMKEGKGWSEARKPIYEKDLWDDRGDWFQAPSLRGIADIGVGVAAMALSGGTAIPALLGASAINLADDFVFGALDGIGGYKAWGEVGLDFGKKTLGSAASVAGSGLFFGYGDQAAGFFQKGFSASLSGTSGFGEVVGRAALSGLSAATNAVASSAIGGLYWKDGGLGWSGSAFASGVKRGLIASASAMTSALVNGSLGLVDLNDANNRALSGEVFNTAGISRLNALAAGLAGEAVSSAFTGDFAVNVLNASGLSGGALSGGLLELHLGANGASMNFGASGADSSLDAIRAGLSGIGDAARVAIAKGSALFGAFEGVSTLNAVNMLGYSGGDSAVSLARALWSGDLEAVYRDDLDAGAGYYGAYDRGGAPGAIGLSSDLLGLGDEKAALLAGVMTHEGSHARGTRVEAAAIIEHLDTYFDLSAMFGLDIDSGFVDGSLASLAESASWAENSGAVDNLRVRLDGSIYDDGNNDAVNFDDGRESIALGTGLGKQGALEAWLGTTGVKDFNAYVALIKASGNRLVDGKWSQELEISRDVVDLAYKNGRLSEEQYRSIVGGMRTDADSAAIEQKGLRAFQAVTQSREKLAELIAGNLFVPGAVAFGSGGAGDPYIFTGQGGPSQIDFSAASDGRYDEIGPCYLMANSVPFLLMGASKKAVYDALLEMEDGIVEANTAAFKKDSPVFWEYMRTKLKMTGAVSWYGGSRQEMDWDAFASSGADMGLLWMDNPKREDDSQHWGFVYKVDDSWYFQDPWNPSERGIFETWDVGSWEEIKALSIRPVQITVPY